MFPDKRTECTKGAFTTADLEYEWSLFRIVSRARRERNTREKWPREILGATISRGHYFSRVSFASRSTELAKEELLIVYRGISSVEQESR